MISELISAGARIDTVTSEGWSPLYLASSYESTARLLRAVGVVTESKHRDSIRNERMHQSIPETEVIAVRFRIYFGSSLLLRLLFWL